MKLIKPTPPPECVSAMRTGLPRFVNPGDAAAARLAQDYNAYELYNLNLRTLAQTGNLSQSARAAGWLFLMADDTGDLACGVSPSNPSRAVCVMQTPEINVAIHRLRHLENVLNGTALQAKSWEKVTEQNANFELRLLRIPSLLIDAAWLHRQNGGQQARTLRRNQHGQPEADADFFIPCMGFLESNGKTRLDQDDVRAWGWKLRRMEPITPEELLEEVGEAVNHRLAKQNKLHGQQACSAAV